MNKSQKLTLIGYCSSLALILATTNLVRAGESTQHRDSFHSPTVVSTAVKSENTEIINDTPQTEQELALSTGSSDKKTTDGKSCACMGYSNFCLNCQHSPEVVG